MEEQGVVLVSLDDRLVHRPAPEEPVDGRKGVEVTGPSPRMRARMRDDEDLAEDARRE